MKPAFIRRADLLEGLDGVSREAEDAHDKLMSECLLFWDVMLPPEAVEFLASLPMPMESTECNGYLKVPLLAHESCVEIIRMWEAFVAAKVDPK